MTSKVGLLCLVCLLSIGMIAQQPQQSKPAEQKPGQLGTVRNDRSSTVPQVGVSAQAGSQNELVGCIARDGQQVVLTQPEQRRSYQLRGDRAELANNAGKMVKVTGRLLLGEPSAFQVQQVEMLQERCQDAHTSALPATGKTGGNHVAENVTSTATLGQVTPGVQTERGAEQNPSTTESAQKYGANPQPHPEPTASQGAPQNPTGNLTVDQSQKIANAAQQSELTSQSKLGVNAQPDYSTAGNAQQNAQATANTAKQKRGELAGGEQGRAGQAPSNQQQAKASSGTAPVFVGCLIQSGKDLTLVEQGSNEHFRVDGDLAKLKGHVNHMVQIVGGKTGTYGPAIGTSGNYATVHVQAIQDVSPTCGKQ